MSAKFCADGLISSQSPGPLPWVDLDPHPSGQNGIVRPNRRTTTPPQGMVSPTGSKWRHAGQGTRLGDDWCANPQRFVNVETGDHFDRRCGSARPSRCAYCAEIKRGDIAAIGRSGWTDRPADSGFWLTLTAPGEDVLPWDRTKCTHSPGIKCSGDIGCVCEAQALARWHDDVAQRWSWFVTDLRRELKTDVQFFKTYEPQKREALHIHAMARAAGVTERRFRAAVRLCARRWGFGPQSKCELIDLTNPVNAARKAGYCAKYSTKSADHLPDVVRVNSAGEIRIGGLRSWSSSRQWGCTMKHLAERRRNWWLGADVSVIDGVDADAPPGAAGALDLYGDFYATAVPGLSIWKPNSPTMPM